MQYIDVKVQVSVGTYKEINSPRLGRSTQLQNIPRNFKIALLAGDAPHH